MVNENEDPDVQVCDESFESARDDIDMSSDNVISDQADDATVTNQPCDIISEDNDNNTDQVTLRRPARLAGKNNSNAVAEVLFLYGDEPATYDEAPTCDDALKWKKAMQEEYDSLIKYNTWELVKVPRNCILVTCKWIYKVKMCTNGTVERFKARSMARGFSQVEGLDFKETYSPVARLESIRVLLSIASNYDMEMLYFDIKTAFLYGSLAEDTYMIQPRGFEKDGDNACKLKRSLYGLIQTSRE